MKDFLQDLVSHTHNLGFLETLKITATDNATIVESMAADRSVILNAKTHTPIENLLGTFGMPNLNKLDIHLKCPEYQDGATIKVVEAERNGKTIPVGLHFENMNGDFENDYRFMNEEIINESLKTVKFKGAKWDIEFEPTVNSIAKLRFQAAANSEEKTFQTSTENDKLICKFGDGSQHAGSFTFQDGITGKLKQKWSWPVEQVLKILNLNGDKVMRIADQGALNITVDSGVAKYDYILPAQTK
jgi:hypothetical protein